MSQPQHHALHMTDHWHEDLQDSAPYPVFRDSSEPLFTMYCKTTEKDNKKAEFSQKYAEVIIIFMGLFSAVVAAILAVTLQDLKPDTQEKSAFYLENLYQLQFLGDSNEPRPSTPAQPPPFSPSRYAIWANALLFMSLTFDLGTAIIAISIRRWMTKSLLFTRSLQNSPHDRARVQDVIVNEYEDLDALPAWVVRIMIHISAFLLWAGISVYLFPINKPVFIAFISSGFIAFVLYVGVLCWLRRVRSKARSSESDVRVLDRLLKAVAEDADLVQFFENILAFCQSKIVDDPLQKITKLGSERFQTAVQKLLEHAWSSNLLSVSEKLRRLLVCVNFADTIRLPKVTSSILEHVFTQGQHDVLCSVEMGHLLRLKDNTTGQKNGSCTQSIVAGIISKVQADNSDWIALATDQLGPSLPRYLGHGNDSVLLANLIHITRQNLESSRDCPGRHISDAASSHIFSTLSNFDIRNTLPELQHDFLVLWNEIDREAPNSGGVLGKIRDHLRHFHNSLTQGNGLTLEPEVRHDPLNHNRDSVTPSFTSIQSSFNLNPAPLSPQIPAPSHTLSQQALAPNTALSALLRLEV